MSLPKLMDIFYMLVCVVCVCIYECMWCVCVTDVFVKYIMASIAMATVLVDCTTLVARCIWNTQAFSLSNTHTHTHAAAAPSLSLSLSLSSVALCTV